MNRYSRRRVVARLALVIALIGGNQRAFACENLEEYLGEYFDCVPRNTTICVCPSGGGDSDKPTDPLILLGVGVTGVIVGSCLTAGSDCWKFLYKRIKKRVTGKDNDDEDLERKINTLVEKKLKERERAQHFQNDEDLDELGLGLDESDSEEIANNEDDMENGLELKMISLPKKSVISSTSSLKDDDEECEEGEQGNETQEKLDKSKEDGKEG